jgi:NAD(P)-dependent dehydrogenase (short-subunit alcohol dehydrogenase family)
VIAISSFVAHAFRAGVATFPASASAKAGLEALVRALAFELAPAGVAVNAVVPVSSARTRARTPRSWPPPSRSWHPRTPPISPASCGTSMVAW